MGVADMKETQREMMCTGADLGMLKGGGHSCI